jgi:hypothetical protein
MLVVHRQCPERLAFEHSSGTSPEFEQRLPVSRGVAMTVLPPARQCKPVERLGAKANASHSIVSRAPEVSVTARS